MRGIFCVAMLAVVGCSNEPLPEEADDSVEQMVKKRVHHRCSFIGKTCATDTDCGGCGFCEFVSYVAQRCVAPLKNGEYCARDNQCKSKHCQNYQCAAQGCASVDTACKVDTDCCSGSFCQNDTYAPWVCTTLRPKGNFCSRNSECTSQKCTNYRCA